MSTELATPTPPKPRNLRELVASDKAKEQFALSLPKHLSPDRFVRVALTAMTRNPRLLECTQESVMKCLMDLTAYGLEADGRRAHLIPYRNNRAGTTECQLIVDWKGLAELALRSGMIAKLHADIVCENDVFEYNMGEVTKHVVNWRKPRGEPYAAYAMAQTKTGEKFFAVMSEEEIEGVRKRSRSGNDGPWVTDKNEMRKKTAFRRLAKWLPLSAEFRDALEKDDEREGFRDITPAASAPLTFEPPAAAPQEPLPEGERVPAVFDTNTENLTLSDDEPTAREQLGMALNERDLDGAWAVQRFNEMRKPRKKWNSLAEVPDAEIRMALDDQDNFFAI